MSHLCWLLVQSACPCLSYAYNSDLKIGVELFRQSELNCFIKMWCLCLFTSFCDFQEVGTSWFQSFSVGLDAV